MKKTNNLVALFIASATLPNSEEKNLFQSANKASLCLDKRRKRRPKMVVQDILNSMDAFYLKSVNAYNNKDIIKMSGRLDETIRAHGSDMEYAFIEFLDVTAESLHRQLGVFVRGYKKELKWLGEYSNKVTFYNAMPVSDIFDKDDHKKFNRIACAVRVHANRLLEQIRNFENLHKKICKQ